ncbi:MAG TPA: hypothetical protein VKB96_08215, partial [Gammaproteobacteria bacterium]|nr:hypothetical protein [Gammaproteobacteria bacterium]
MAGIPSNLQEVGGDKALSNVRTIRRTVRTRAGISLGDINRDFCSEMSRLSIISDSVYRAEHISSQVGNAFDTQIISLGEIPDEEPS